MSAALVELLVRLEQAALEADAFVVVTVDKESGGVVNATGPYSDPEQALVAAGRQDADWKNHAEPGEGDWRYVVVPLWEPVS